MLMAHDPLLASLSIVVAILASYTAFNLAERVRYARAGKRGVWLLAGAAALGLGIWSMHFVAMLAMEVPFPVAYDPYLVALSAVAAAAGSAVALFFVTRDRLSPRGLFLGGACMGGAIAAMHYIGMAALRAPVDVSYRTSLVLASLGVAVVVSWVAMALLYRLRDDNKAGALLGRLVSAPFMGLAIAGMHYTAMAAVRFGPPGSSPFDPHGLLLHGTELGMLVTGTTLTILATALISSRIERGAQEEIRGAQAERLQTQELYQELVELSPVGILALTGDVISYANPAAATLLRVMDGDLVGRSLREFTRGAEGGGLLAPAAPASTGAARAMELDLIGDDGSEVPVELLSIPAAGSDGPDRQVILRDLSAQRAAAEERRRSDARFRSLTENAAELIIVYAPNGRVRYQTPSVQRVLGYAQDELTALDPFDLIHPEDTGPAREMLTAILDGVTRSRSGLIRVRHKDGSWRFLDLFLTNLIDDPTIEGVVCNCHDVTERLDLESQLQHSQRLEVVGGMAAAVAHDINNVVTSIQAIAGLMEDEIPSVSSMDEDLDEIRKQCDRATTLTRQLLTFSRSQVLEPILVDVHETVGAMEGVIRSVVGEAIPVYLTLEPPPAHIRIDPNELEQILLNLLINARDAIKRADTQGNTIQVRVGREEAAGGEGEPSTLVKLEVEDDGPGIPPEVRDRIFEPFFTTKGPGEGTGLGLATVDRIVTRNGGRVEVESEVGDGTLIRLLLPSAEGVPARDEPPRSESQMVETGQETIMLVEDEESVRLSLARILQRAGYEVTTARDGREALKVAREIGADLELVVSDVVMPGLSGRAMGDLLLERFPTLPILFISGYNEEEALMAPTDHAGVVFLQKPFTPATLLRRIRELLDGVRESPSRDELLETVV